MVSQEEKRGRGRPRVESPVRGWPRVTLRLPPELHREWRLKGGTEGDLRKLVERWVKLQG